MKVLEGLQWQPGHITHLSCVKSCLDYLGAGISHAWLYGGTGHAFILNYGKNACPSGPTAWDTSMLYELAPHLGYRVEGISVWKPDDDALFVGFLQEARERLSGRCDAAFADATGHYTHVCDRLRAVHDLCPQRPWAEDWSETLRSPESAALLREAAAAEEQGLACLRRIAAAL